MTNRLLALSDVEREISVTRKVLARLPEDQFAWKVHEKSMPLGRLAMHVANLLVWATDTVSRDELNMANTPKMRNEPTGLQDLLDTFDANVAAFRAAMESVDDAKLAATWKLVQGDKVLVAEPRMKILRTWCLNHMVHHRAQLCVYLRLLGQPVPTVYFNSADEPDWDFG